MRQEAWAAALVRGLSAVVLAAFVSFHWPSTDASAGQVADEGQGLVPRGAINIVRNAEFTPANGVVAGTGVAIDPFIIAGWEINASQSDALSISDTDAHFIVRDVRLHSGRNPLPNPSHDGIVLTNVTNGRIENSVFENLRDAVALDRAVNNTILGNAISESRYGIVSYVSRNLVFSENSVRWCDWPCVYAYDSQNVTISSNAISNGNSSGISLFSSSLVRIVDNIAQVNALDGVVADSSHFIDLRGNRVSQNGFSGIRLLFSDNVTLGGNTIAGNARGAYLASSRDIRISRNNFEGNSVQAFDDGVSSNAWDGGYPAGGNYWSDYVGADACRGPTQSDCSGPDGFGDSPYAIDADDMDRYPLMSRLNTPPVARFQVTPVAGNVTTIFTTDASASRDLEDPLDLLDFRWDWEDDGAWDTGWTSSRTASHSYPAPGSYAIRLQVRDPGGLSNETSLAVIVENTPPTAMFTVSPPTGTVQTLFSLDASLSSDMEDSAAELQVRWDWEDDGAWDTSLSFVKVAEHEYAFPGVHTIRLEVRDNGGLTGQTTKTVTVSNTPPIASLVVAPSAGTIETVFAFDASGSSDLETPDMELEVRWDWEDDGVWDTFWTDSKTATHRYPSPGQYIVRLEVRDTGGLTHNTAEQVIVEDTPPFASFVVAPSSGTTKTVFTFDASASSDLEDQASALEVRWDWEDDGVWDTSWTTVKVAQHTFQEPGAYTIRMHIRDGTGLAASATQVVTVEPEPAGTPYLLIGILIVVIVTAATAVVLRSRRNRRKGEAE